MMRIGVLTSGGDCPGMNPCIRSIVRFGIYKGLEVMGIRRGYAGLIDNDIIQMNAGSVSGIIYKGGTILKTARSKYFMEKDGQKKAVENIRKSRIDALIVIGGDGSLRGANVLSKVWKIPVVGVPSTIDNDIWGTDFSIGFFTAVSTALEAIDKIRDTATSHERLFLIEVMGRTCGAIALWSGVAGGAEDILIPEKHTDLDEICDRLEEGRKRGKVSSIIIVAEGNKSGSVFEIASRISKKINYESRVVVLGHLQRGGSPCAWDRVLGTMLGKAAVDALFKGESNVMVGFVNGKIKVSSLENVLNNEKQADLDLYSLNEIMAT
ncbi:6-phosphofructokinase [Candidatus Aerophobetes bacterium]|nr:6-phosphofructokinase [Candidatus Aerophobetes bacterium]